MRGSHVRQDVTATPFDHAGRHQRGMDPGTWPALCRGGCCCSCLLPSAHSKPGPALVQNPRSAHASPPQRSTPSLQVNAKLLPGIARAVVDAIAQGSCRQAGCRRLDMLCPRSSCACCVCCFGFGNGKHAGAAARVAVASSHDRCNEAHVYNVTSHSALTDSVEHPCAGGETAMAFTKGLAYAFHFYGQIGVTKLLTQVSLEDRWSRHLRPAGTLMILICIR
jgi:hypothetical protein